MSRFHTKPKVTKQNLAPSFMYHLAKVVLSYCISQKKTHRYWFCIG